MLTPIKTIFAVFRTYDYRDKLLTALGLVVFLLMIIKMLIFPYGIFGFGSTAVYTEGLVARNGIQNINPLFVDYNEADREVAQLVFSGLMKYDPDRQAVVDDMATLTINEEKTEYTFELLEGLKWHDGADVTTDDVYFTFHDVVQNPAFQNDILKTNFAGVGIEVINARKIKFTLEKPNVFFISNMTTGILPEHVLRDVAPEELLQDEFNKKPIGTGPYMVTEPVEVFQDGRTQITLERSPYYYNKPSDIEFMRFIAYPDNLALFESLNSVNGIVKVSGDDLYRFENEDRFELIPYELPQYVAVFMNMDSQVLKDATKVRLALQKAIDKDELIGGALDKARVDTPLLELNQEDWEYQPSMEEARGALKDSGYNYSPEDEEKVGIRYDEDGNALELRMIVRAYPEGSKQFDEVLNTVDYLQGVWEEIGFSIQVEFLPLDEFNERATSRQYDLLLVGQSLGYNLDTYSYWHSTQATPLGQNFSNYRSFQVDALIEDIRSIFDKEKRDQRLQELAEKLKDDVPAVFLYRPIYYYASDGKVSGVNMDGLTFPSDRLIRISEWMFAR